jgi:shikimate kinase
VGKTTVGKALAEQLEWEFMDTDDLIEQREKCSLQEIVDQQGYEALRGLEEKVLLEVYAQNTVIATGGSVVYSTPGMTHLRNVGQLIWLQADPVALLERIGDPSGRGLAKPQEQSLEDLFIEREDLYARWAEVLISEPDVDSAVTAIREQAGLSLPGTP